MTRRRIAYLLHGRISFHRVGHWMVLGLLLAVTFPSNANAQGASQAAIQGALYASGDAAVTGFSGALPPIQIAPGIDPNQQTFIDLNGPSLRIVDLQHMGGPPAAQLVGAPKPLTIQAGKIGQVFGVTLDDAEPPNIYAAASSAYGLPIVAPGADAPWEHIQVGAAKARFMPGLWGQGGGPGSIWKINSQSGAVSLFTDVGRGGAANSGAALGALAYDPGSRSLYAADRETGLIHHISADGSDRGVFDHGVQGRAAQGLPPIKPQPPPGLDITSPNFDSTQPSTWHYAAPERRIFGLAIFEHRLFYAVANSLQIWSVGLTADGGFADDALIELQVPPASGPTEISEITFDEQGRLWLAERAAPTGAFDFAELAVAGIGRVLRYAVTGHTANGRRIWQPQPSEFAIGFPMTYQNGNGGIAIGYQYDAHGDLALNSCGGFLWSTGEDLRRPADPALASKLEQSGKLDIAGLQGNGSWLARPANTPPTESYFIEYIDQAADPTARGHLGAIAIKRNCVTEKRVDLLPLPLPQGLPPPARTGPAFPPPGVPHTPPGTPSTPPSCNPDQLRRVHDNSCTPTCPRPDIQIGGTCCEPGDFILGGGCSNASCPAGQTPIGPSHFCCATGQVYSGSGGVAACCPGQLVNGQCQFVPPPPTPICLPGSNNARCCPIGYTITGNTCCLAGKVTSSGVCCPAGESPSGPNHSQCLPILHIPQGPQCCTAGLIPAGDGQCCPAANLTSSGVCCPAAVDPTNRANCPAQIQIVKQCAAGYTRMPNGSCCNNRFVGADGKTCGPQPGPCGPGEFRAPGGACAPIVVPDCAPGEIRHDGACGPERPVDCRPGEVRRDDGVCGPPRPANCPPGQVRDGDGDCVHIPLHPAPPRHGPHGPPGPHDGPPRPPGPPPGLGPRGHIGGFQPGPFRGPPGFRPGLGPR